jgi:hypothetical protein
VNHRDPQDLTTVYVLLGILFGIVVGRLLPRDDD